MKQAGEPIVCVTAYDYTMARLVDQAGIPVVLVGDSLGNVVLGYDSTLPVTLDDVIHHTRAVVRGAKDALIVADMPFMTYNVSVEDALRNAGRLLQEGGAQAVKLEGG
ncbi:MAG: 3-methyl-2-oxobutanoate hydroxymethyltransferase, partial [Chloroflexi bacterium]|nr:3-methyl-2-oxobutanoate hydroxymethyltransferase [Chloroflexota bacterium]